MARACTRPNASTGCRRRRKAAIRAARSRSCSMIAGAWRIVSIGCAPAMPGRRRRSRARCGWSRMSRCLPPVHARMVRSNLLISEFRLDGIRFLSGLCAHRFVRAGWPLADRGAAGQSDRLRSELAQSQHRDLITKRHRLHPHCSPPRKRDPESLCCLRGNDRGLWLGDNTASCAVPMGHGARLKSLK